VAIPAVIVALLASLITTAVLVRRRRLSVVA